MIDYIEEDSSEVDVLKTSPQAALKIKGLVSDAMRKCLSPPPKLNLVEWADTYRFLPDNSALSGRWSTDVVHAAREPMLSVTNPDVQEVTIMSCIQFMKTELMINTALYYMHQEPSPIMYVAPKEKTAEAWSKERLVKSVNSTPVISDIFSKNRRGEGNTITQKQFPGGQISIMSANNPTDLAMRACRIMLFDECDKYPINVGSGEKGSGGEGDPITVAWGRATTYGKRAKKIVACSPTVKGVSRIEQEYENSNMSVFNQVCPHCNHAKVLEWTDVKIPRDKNKKFLHREAQIVCSDCGVLWNEADRLKSIKKGFWVALKPEITWHHGYKVSSLASPFTSVQMLAKEFSDAQKNLEKLKAFYNTRMAETWSEQGEQPDWEKLYKRREKYKTKVVPDGALMITCGIDVQKGANNKGYLVYEVVGWGRRNESWSIDAGIVEGNIEDDSTKEKLSKLLDTTYKNSSGIDVPIMRACIDSGYSANEVYSFCRQHNSTAVVPVKGDKDGNLRAPLGVPTFVDVTVSGKRFSRGMQLWKVGSGVIKEQLYRWFNCDEPVTKDVDKQVDYPSGYSHFPQYDEEFFKQICAESLIKMTDNRGFTKEFWKKTRERNDFLDCRVYARAGSVMLQIHRMSDEDWDELERTWHGSKEPNESEDNIPTVEQTKKSIRRKANWIKR